MSIFVGEEARCAERATLEINRRERSLAPMQLGNDLESFEGLFSPLIFVVLLWAICI